jgi:hypothetical protein
MEMSVGGFSDFFPAAGYCYFIQEKRNRMSYLLSYLFMVRQH